ncbi:hypothetical protein [Streptomyces synnematoformans]|uniref:DUF4352 domain-containing protein n=1 Tax=Streptomyces synnematoformans TaxID=415721 RepID=A0ABP5J1Q3_9ACTN
MSYPTQPQQPYGAPPPQPPVPPMPPRKRRPVLQITGVIIAVFAVFGIGAAVGVAASSDNGKNSAEPAPTVTVTATPGADNTEGTAAEEADDAEQPGDDTFKLTEPVLYETGVEVTLSKFERATSSEWAAPADTPYVKFNVKITNGSEESIDLNEMLVECQYGDSTGEQIFDDGLDTPTTHLRPGRTMDLPTGCELPADESYVQIEMAPDFESETAIFAGTVR